MQPYRVFQVLQRRVLQPLHTTCSLFPRKRFSVLYLLSDWYGWVLDEEMIELRRVAEGIGVNARVTYGVSKHAQQCCHFTSHLVLLEPKHFQTSNRISIDYYHGLPNTEKVFMDVYQKLKAYHPNIARVRVSHSQMEQIVLESGIDPGKVHRIPIGINLEHFTKQTQLFVFCKHGGS